ncbi:phage holin family protein [Streptomyces sp. SP18CS02]|uniref:phage holin family protein n=1 Tax=Streptomyces sp. SP18CS02 TaxID=3002531 RepID=UPI002E7A4F79|nr:phage holin family protein [Streptomyces sp. SP18CS02]MEE1752765.1 phage holin family protein [Streptomyces sp. SP18CS02]
MRTDDRPTGHIGQDDSVGTLVTQASQQVSQLVRDEMRLAQAEMVRKGKRFGAGGGLFGGAGAAVFLALQALVITGIAALSLVLPVWASALIACGVLLVIAAVLALNGKKQVARATPPVPERTIDSVKADVAEIKEKAHR